MKKETVEISDCNECRFMHLDFNLDEFCIWDQKLLVRVAVPFQVGKYTLKHAYDKCYFKNREVTIKLKPKK